MPTIQQQRDKLIGLLKELFQLDQPDLDFGFYRIMHAKAREVTAFLEEDLLKTVEEKFGQGNAASIAQLQKAYDDAVAQAKSFGAADPEQTEPVKRAKAALAAAKDTSRAEGEVYDHLYRFFERYYDAGDFMSRRYLSRETSSKAAAYAVPYDGSEVYLHWANKDQYYIKTAEYFTDFTFDPAQAPEVRQAEGLFKAPDQPLRVHFRIVAATEGEHGNIKAGNGAKRYFILHKDDPVSIENGDLVVRFEYRPDPERSGQDQTWQAKRNEEAVAGILEALDRLDDARAREYSAILKTPAPTEKRPDRPLLAKYIAQYTARNTMDYFIHKDLGGFLRRELDFYIKNEVMRLDDIENADAPAVESYLAKIKVLRKIAGKLIDFLAQLEDFQKKLWLKKKFVIETNYCITLDRICNEQSTMSNEQKWLLEQVVSNKAQWAEWQKLGFVQLAINNEQLTEKSVLEAEDFTISFNGEKQEGDLFAKEPLTYRKLIDDCSLIIDHWNLVLDTRFFDDSFKARLVASIENFDEQCDGLLIHSENLQALNLLQERYREQVKCVYIDPPYNTASTPILYKNEYRHSSWAALMWDRLAISRVVMKKNGVKSVAIDDTEMVNLSKILEDVYPEFRQSRVTVIHNPKGSITKDFNRVHEYSLFLTKEEDKTAIARTLEENKTPRKMRRWGENSLRTERRLSFYPIYVKDGKIVRVGEVPPDDFHPTGRNVKQEDGEIEIWPIDQDGVERRWNFGLDSIYENLQRVTIQEVDNTLDLFLTHELTVPKTVWNGGEFDAGNYGNTLLINILGNKLFDFPKSINLVKRCICLSTTNDNDSVVLDYFGGSGTTAHATIELNKEDDGKRKYILVEMGDYFDTVLKPRIAKVVYSERWKDGRPIINEQLSMDKKKDGSLVTDHCSLFNGISHCFKTIRLESYEDTLNNLRFEDNPQRTKAVSANSSLKEDYMLRYWLDVETRGSQSLLNIDAFADPTAYTLEVKKPGTDEYTTRAVDLIETFNYLIGLRVDHYSAPQEFTANFKRIEDPEVPQGQITKLVLDGRLQQVKTAHEDTKARRGEKEKTVVCDAGSAAGVLKEAAGEVTNKNLRVSVPSCETSSPTWWFRKVEGWVPADPADPNNGRREKVLIVWRKLTGDIEQDNLVLDEWFRKYQINPRASYDYDTIYVNGSNNLPNLKLENENWRVRLIEEDFHRLMWDVEDV